MPETEKFAFGVIDKKLGFTQNKDVQSLFSKWDLQLNVQYFNFDKVRFLQPSFGSSLKACNFCIKLWPRQQTIMTD